MAQFPFSFWKPSVPNWPIGTDGAFSLTDGSTFDLPAGSVKDYSSITITNGSTLRIGAFNLSSAWTILGCSGDFTFGSSFIKANSNGGGDGTFSTTAPDGTSLTYTIVQQPGGSGGDITGPAGNTGAGSIQGSGGGGASGIENGFTGDINRGGAGGFDGAFTFDDPGGGFPSQNGSDGASNTTTLSESDGGGGGGGGTAAAGGAIYIKVAGQIIFTGSNTISVSGGNGGNGGNGGSATCSSGLNDSVGGGGGGGGAGGAGGYIKIRWKTGSDPTAACFAIGGDQGIGGSGGGAPPIPNGYAGVGGSNGTDGNNGTIDIALY